MTTTSAEQELIVKTVREFVDREVMPVASAMEHRDEYPDALVQQMIEIGLFGLNVPPEYDGVAVDYTTFARIFEELARGWLGLAGILGTHLVLCDVITTFGTADQKRRFLPALARAEVRGALCLSEPGAGTDLQSIRTTASKDGSDYVINGSKMWITNARHAGLHLVLVKTDPAAQPAHKGMGAFIVDARTPGLTVGRDIEKLGYRGLETCEVHFESVRVPAADLVGGSEGHGFHQVMTGLETERINVAARALGIARAGIRGSDPLRAAAGHVRQADRAASGDSAEARGHGDAHRSVAAADLLGGGTQGPGRALRSGSGDGQDVCQRDRRRRELRGDEDPWRQRVFERLPGGTLLSRRAAHGDRRRHERAAAPDHRQAAPRKVPRLIARPRRERSPGYFGDITSSIWLPSGSFTNA
jgi:alkylation response protein AidB-like acyl-CoA dehydrogenase